MNKPSEIIQYAIDNGYYTGEKEDHISKHYMCIAVGRMGPDWGNIISHTQVEAVESQILSELGGEFTLPTFLSDRFEAAGIKRSPSGPYNGPRKVPTSAKMAFWRVFIRKLQAQGL